jgi:3-deoxy-D-manno-octulosonic acid (KDO) 8-phosphate synthase
VLEAMRSEVDALRASLETHPDAMRTPSDGSPALAAELLEGTQAEMAELSQLLDHLVDRVTDLDARQAKSDGGR